MEWDPVVTWREYEGGTNAAHWHDVELLTANSREEGGVPEYRAALKWDGCIHLDQFANGDDPATNPKCERDYLHICNLGIFIKQMQALLDEGRRRFGADWGR